MTSPRTRRQVDKRLDAARETAPDASSMGSCDVIDASRTEQGSDSKGRTAAVWVQSPTGGGVPNLVVAERRKAVYPLMLAGYSIQAIANKLHVQWDTAKNDVAYLKATTLTRVDPELLRVASNEAMLEIQDIARERHREGNVTEGRLAIDAWNRIAKTNALEETATERETGGALAQLMHAMARRVGGEVVDALDDGEDT